MDDFSGFGFTGLIRESKFRGLRRSLRCIQSSVDFGDHLRLTGGALKNWLIGLYLLKIPLAPAWAILAAILQFIPHLGPVLGMIGPVLAAAIGWADWQHPIYVLCLYAGIALIDGFLLQPVIMKRTAKVPIWASILAPIVLGFLIPFWGVLLAPPVLAIVYAYKARQDRPKLPQV